MSTAVACGLVESCTRMQHVVSRAFAHMIVNAPARACLERNQRHYVGGEVHCNTQVCFAMRFDSRYAVCAPIRVSKTAYRSAFSGRVNMRETPRHSFLRYLFLSATQRRARITPLIHLLMRCFPFLFTEKKIIERFKSHWYIQESGTMFCILMEKCFC